MVGWRDQVALQAARGEAPHEVYASARRIHDAHAGLLLLERLLDLSERGEQAAGVAHMQRLLLRRERNDHSTCD